MLIIVLTYRGAGSNGAAIALTFALYSIIADRKIWERLSRDIRSTFEMAENITGQSTEQLPFLNAVINESNCPCLVCLMIALRLYPPLSAMQPRVTPAEGMMIAGRFIDGKI